MDSPPEKIPSDYIELTSLVLLFIVGAPLNLAAFTQIAERPIYTRLDILKRHLNYSDLLVLFVYVPSRACWLYTYDWRGGDFLCRLVKFMHTFAFQVSSNVIVCIAVDRLLTVISSTHRNPDVAQRRMRLMLWIAWSTSLLISSPQFAIWRNYVAFERPIKWSQCMQIWEIARKTVPSHFSASINGTATVGIVEVSSTHQLMLQEKIYVVVHMLLIFWVPAAIILLCYVVVSCWVYLNSKTSSMTIPKECENKLMPKLRLGTVSYHTTDGEILVDTSTTITRTGTTSTTAVCHPKIVINGRNASCSPTPGQEGSARTGSNASSNTSLSIEMKPNGGILHQRASQSSTCSAKQNRRRAIRVSFLLVAGYFACWLPYNILSLIQFIDPETFNEHVNEIYCLNAFIVFNSVINPYLYGLFGGLCRKRRRDS